MSRFIIGLRNVSSGTGDDSFTTSKPAPATLRFATVETIVGSLGAELRLGSGGDVGEGDSDEDENEDGDEISGSIWDAGGEGTYLKPHPLCDRDLESSIVHMY